MAHQVFISYGHDDKLVADAACARLEARGIRCWIAPRDVLPGQSYGEAINTAIHGSRAMVLVFSSKANLSEHVGKEVERAVSNSIPVVPLRIENVAPTGALEYFIGSVHWLDALTPPIEQHLEYLADSIQRLLNGPEKQYDGPRPIPGRKKPMGRYVALGVLALALIAGFNYFYRVCCGPPPIAPPIETAGIVGCWLYNNTTLEMTANGRITRFWGEATWRSEGGNRYSFTWPQVSDTIQIAPGGGSLTGTNNYGPAISARRIAAGGTGPSSFVGTWLWSNNATVVASPNGSVATGPATGRWISLGGASYKIDWNLNPVDQLVLSPDGRTISGQNNFGASLSGTRTACPN
jgi:hypothetical protein